MGFLNREHAARMLASQLSKYTGENPVILGFPPGGVPMAKIISDQTLGDLDIYLIHRLCLPSQPDYVIGTVTEDGHMTLTPGASRWELDEAQIAAHAELEISKLQQLRRLYKPRQTPLSLRGRVVIIVDDGTTAPLTLLAVLEHLRDYSPRELIVATPVMAPDQVQKIEAMDAQVFALLTPPLYFSVHRFFDSFKPVQDEEIQNALSGTPEEIWISESGLKLRATISIPHQPKAVVILLDNGPRGRKSMRLQLIARVLQNSGFVSFAPDLIEPNEISNNIHVLSHRLGITTEWIAHQEKIRDLYVGYLAFGEMAAASLEAAVQLRFKAKAIVSCSGRPDLTSHYLPYLQAPTLFIVGGLDTPRIYLGQEALEQMKCERKILILPGASQEFSEAGALPTLIRSSLEWLTRYLKPQVSPKHEAAPVFG